VAPLRTRARHDGLLLEFFAEPPIVWFVDGEGTNRVLANLSRDFARNSQRAEDEFRR
jgi:hypothetical protein